MFTMIWFSTMLPLISTLPLSVSAMPTASFSRNNTQLINTLDESFKILVTSQKPNGIYHTAPGEPYTHYFLQPHHNEYIYGEYVFDIGVAAGALDAWTLQNGTLISYGAAPNGTYATISYNNDGGCGYGAIQMLSNSYSESIGGGFLALNTKTNLLTSRNPEVWDKGTGKLKDCEGPGHWNFCYSEYDGSGPFLQLGQLGGKDCEKVNLSFASFDTN